MNVATFFNEWLLLSFAQSFVSSAVSGLYVTLVAVSFVPSHNWSKEWFPLRCLLIRNILIGNAMQATELMYLSGTHYARITGWTTNLTSWRIPHSQRSWQLFLWLCPANQLQWWSISSICTCRKGPAFTVWINSMQTHLSFNSVYASLIPGEHPVVNQVLNQDEQLED